MNIKHVAWGAFSRWYPEKLLFLVSKYQISLSIYHQNVYSIGMDPVDLNKYLLSRSYLIGNSFTYADLTLFNLIDEKRSQYTKFSHVIRWLNHIKAIRSCTSGTLSSGK